MAHAIEGTLGEAKGDFAIVVSQYNDSITKKLLDGALATLRASGVPENQVHVSWVPGAWEIPLAAKRWAQNPKIAAVITLGAVIRGETTHDQHINRAVSQAIMQISLETNKPIALGLLTVNTLEQAIHRAGGNVGNKGEEAAQAAIQMVHLLANLSRK